MPRGIPCKQAVGDGSPVLKKTNHNRIFGWSALRITPHQSFAKGKRHSIQAESLEYVLKGKPLVCVTKYALEGEAFGY